MFQDLQERARLETILRMEALEGMISPLTTDESLDLYWSFFEKVCCLPVCIIYNIFATHALFLTAIPKQGSMLVCRVFDIAGVSLHLEFVRAQARRVSFSGVL